MDGRLPGTSTGTGTAAPSRTASSASPAPALIVRGQFLCRESTMEKIASGSTSQMLGDYLHLRNDSENTKRLCCQQINLPILQLKNSYPYIHYETIFLLTSRVVSMVKFTAKQSSVKTTTTEVNKKLILLFCCYNPIFFKYGQNSFRSTILLDGRLPGTSTGTGTAAPSRTASSASPAPASIAHGRFHCRELTMENIASGSTSQMLADCLRLRIDSEDTKRLCGRK